MESRLIYIGKKTVKRKRGYGKSKKKDLTPITYKKYHISKYFPWVATAMILALTAVLRFSMLQMPLERDEGEFAYMGQLLLQGIPPYLMAYSMKLPGIYAIYALIMGIFGQSIFAIHLGLLIFNGIAIVLVFLLTRYLADEVAGVVEPWLMHCCP